MIKKLCTLLALAFCLNGKAQCTLTVTVNSPTICAGSSCTLTATGANSYSWAPFSAINSDTGSVVVANPTVTTSYTVVGSSGTCYSATTLTVNVNPAPIPIITSTNVATCQYFSNATTLTVPTSTNTYVWYTGNTYLATGASYTPPYYLTPGTYTYIAIDSITVSNGCLPYVNTSTFTLTVNPLPSPPALTAPTAVNNISCAGSPPTLTVNSGTSIAEWYSGNTLLYIGSSYTPPASLPPGTYTYSVIDSSATPAGCISAPPSANTVTLSVTVNAVPAAPVLTGSVNTIVECQGEIPAVTYSVEPVVGLLPIWYSGMNLVATGNMFTPSNAISGNFNYTVYDSSSISGCTSLSSGNILTVSVIVNPSPIVTYTLVADTAPHTWNAYPTYSGGAGAYTYLWSWGDGTPPSTTAYPSHVYASPGSYSICVTITDANGCTSTYCQYDAVSRLGNNSLLNTMVYVNVKNNTTGISQISGLNTNISIYPNPNNGSFVIEPNSATKQTIQVYDVKGKLLLSQTINGKTSIDAGSLQEGIYNISIISNEGVINKRMVIVR